MGRLGAMNWPSSRGAHPELVPLPAHGRRFPGTRRVGLGDVDPSGRLRLDGLAAYLQDVATADADEAALPADVVWVLRKMAVVAARLPVLGERLTLTTFCGGYGSRWAERRTSVTGSAGAAVESVALWVAVDARSGRPVKVPARFHEVYGEAAGGREVGARLHHPDPVDDALPQPWHLVRADLDILGHVNNAAHWRAVEEVLAGRTPVRAEIEFRDALEAPADATLCHVEHDGAVGTWLVQDGRVRSSVLVVLGAPSTAE